MADDKRAAKMANRSTTKVKVDPQNQVCMLLQANGKRTFVKRRDLPEKFKHMEPVKQ
jgi:hypothetical protein